ncbi:MAG: sulfatase-like hydrolase/transferase [Niastella sp.]|nr:sulfatase-like hydrolase/transferase [Niastella sp.]
MTAQLLKNKPWFVLLLPLFFVLHGYAEHYSFIGIQDIAYLLIVYCIATAMLYLLFRLIFRNNTKAAIMTTALMAVYFFYGALFDFLKTHSPIKGLHKYSVLVPLILIALITLFIFLKKSAKPITRFVFFLNVLLLIYLCVDLATIGWKAMRIGNNDMANYGFARNNERHIPDSCKKPDIYYFIFDEYTSSRSLKEKFNYHNDLDSFLLSRDFHIQTNSVSNYNYTPFSVAATLNMQYLTTIDSNAKVNRVDYLNCNPLIRENEVVRFLGMNGYEIVNLSVFDLAGHPSIVQQSFLPLKTKMITEGTLWARVYRDFEWYFFSNKLLARLLGKPAYAYLEHRENNEKLYQEAIRQSTIKNPAPRFIYTHLYMPHMPFFFDRFGNQRADSLIIEEAKTLSAENYIEYLPYVNNKIRKLIDTLQHNTGSSAVIILQGDHGFRTGVNNGIDVFRNLNTTYFPDGNYSKLYDSMSNVNYFRATFNTLYHQQYPMLKDSTIFLSDK